MLYILKFAGYSLTMLMHLSPIPGTAFEGLYLDKLIINDRIYVYIGNGYFDGVSGESLHDATNYANQISSEYHEEKSQIRIKIVRVDLHVSREKSKYIIRLLTKFEYTVGGNVGINWVDERTNKELLKLPMNRALEITWIAPKKIELRTVQSIKIFGHTFEYCGNLMFRAKDQASNAQSEVSNDFRDFALHLMTLHMGQNKAIAITEGVSATIKFITVQTNSIFIKLQAISPNDPCSGTTNGCLVFRDIEILAK